MGLPPASHRALVVCGVIAGTAALLAGCGAATNAISAGSPSGANVTSAPVAVSAGKPATPPRPVPVPGWADNVVTAGDIAYVIGWNRDQSAALWQIDAAGDLSARTPPPGMPGNAGLAATDSFLDLAFDTPDDGLAITGADGDMHRVGHKALYATDDGARTWTKVDLPTGEQPTQIALGHGAAYALTSNCSRPRAACDHATLWSIDPTGQTPPHTFDTLPTQAGIAALSTVAAYGRDAWVLLGLGAGRVIALRSHDAGQTWHRFDGGLCLAAKPVATSADVLWATCATGMMAHFTRQSGGTPPATVFPKVGGTSSSALVPLSDTTAYAIIDAGSGASVEATHDGGRTTATLAPIPDSIARRGFRGTFVSGHVGYLATLNGGRLYRTVDGGESWHLINRPGR